MEFELSTQKSSWFFDSCSIAECRNMAIDITCDEGKSVSIGNFGKRVRKHASGFHRRAQQQQKHRRRVSHLPSSTTKRSVSFNYDELSTRNQTNRTSTSVTGTPTTLTSNEQEVVVRFHAHQLSMLIGPHAYLPTLRTSNTVLATAIILFRRFYLSNSVIDFRPRAMATAAALLASKIEEERRVDVRQLEHATSLIHEKAKAAPSLAGYELIPVSVYEVEAAERNLMEGINYEMRCHHPFSALNKLVSELAPFLSREYGRSFSSTDYSEEKRNPSSELRSPRGVDLSEDSSFLLEKDLHEKAFNIVQNALLISDIPFMFNPGTIAFAAVAMAQRELTHRDFDMKSYLRTRFIHQEEEGLYDFEKDVYEVIHILDNDTIRNLPVLAASIISNRNNNTTWSKIGAKELGCVMEKLANIRLLRGMAQEKITNLVRCRYSTRKRKVEAVSYTPHYALGRVNNNFVKAAKVTPTSSRLELY